MSKKFSKIGTRSSSKFSKTPTQGTQDKTYELVRRVSDLEGEIKKGAEKTKELILKLEAKYQGLLLEQSEELGAKHSREMERVKDTVLLRVAEVYQNMTTCLEIITSAEKVDESLSKSNSFNVVQSGIRSLYAQIRRVLEERASEIETNVGDDFSPELHDALASVSTTEKALHGKVSQVVSTGWKVNNGRVVLKSMVSIFKYNPR